MSVLFVRIIFQYFNLEIIHYAKLAMIDGRMECFLEAKESRKKGIAGFSKARGSILGNDVATKI
jgi:hypothetical protein